MTTTAADVRALLAAERKARRISHPLLTYTRSGQLLCNACQLNVREEQSRRLEEEFEVMEELEERIRRLRERREALRAAELRVEHADKVERSATRDEQDADADADEDEDEVDDWYA
ncbi:hypothetical protein DV735_g449, partial [Chaetothyriales sp. CBS 134920]